MIEFLLSNLTSPSIFRDFIVNLFGGFDETTYNLPRTFFGLYVPLLQYREPSRFALVLLFLLSCQIIYFQSFKHKSSLLISFCLFILLITTNSMSGLIYIVCIFLMIVFSLKQQKNKITLVFLASFIVFFCSLFFSTRLTTIFTTLPLLFKDSPAGLPALSEVVRLYSIANNLKLFLTHFFFGCGLGTLYSYSGLFTTLANIGSVGFVLWLLIIRQNMSHLNISSSSFRKGVLLFCLFYSFTGHMSQMIYLDYSFILLILFCLSPSIEISKNVLYIFAFKLVSYDIQKERRGII